MRVGVYRLEPRRCKNIQNLTNYHLHSGKNDIL